MEDGESKIVKRLKKLINDTIMKILKVFSVFMLGSFIMVMSFTRPTISIELSKYIEELDNIALEIKEVSEATLKLKNNVRKELDKLGKEKPLFLKEVNKIAKDLQVDPAVLLVMFYIESRFDAGIQNDDTNATGIFQLMPRYMPEGMTPARFKNLTATEQLDYYYKMVKPLHTSGHLLHKVELVKGKAIVTKTKTIPIENMYIANFYPKTLVDRSYVIARKGGNVYSNNKGLDVNKDDVIDRGDIRAKILKYLE